MEKTYYQEALDTNSQEEFSNSDLFQRSGWYDLINVANKDNRVGLFP